MPFGPELLRNPLPLRNHAREDVLLDLFDVVDPLQSEVEQLDPEVGGAEGGPLENFRGDRLPAHFDFIQDGRFFLRLH